MRRATASLLELLVEHGIPERGARLYLAACRGGPQTASALARLAGLHRVEAYRFIQQLQREGLLLATGRRPMRLAAVPPGELLERYVRRAADRLQRLEGDRHRLLSDLEEELAGPDPGDDQKFAVLEGRARIQTFLKRRFGSVDREVLLSVSGFSLGWAIDGGVDRSLKEASARGVRVRMVTEVTGANLSDAKHFASFSEVKHAAAPVTNRAIVVDRAGALVFVSGEEGLGPTGDSQVALWSTAPEFIARARQYHTRLWARGLPAAQRIVELESPATPSIPVLHGHLAEPFQRLREITELGMRATGVRELRFDLPEMISAIADQLGGTISTRIEGSTPKEVAASLAEYYRDHAMGRLEIARSEPLTLRVNGCFACLPQSPEIGRVLCPRLLQTVVTKRLGPGWEVSAPDPRRHASRGCLFGVTASA